MIETFKLIWNNNSGKHLLKVLLYTLVYTLTIYLTHVALIWGIGYILLKLIGGMAFMTFSQTCLFYFWCKVVAHIMKDKSND